MQTDKHADRNTLPACRGELNRTPPKVAEVKNNSKCEGEPALSSSVHCLMTGSESETSIDILIVMNHWTNRQTHVDSIGYIPNHSCALYMRCAVKLWSCEKLAINIIFVKLCYEYHTTIASRVHKVIVFFQSYRTTINNGAALYRIHIGVFWAIATAVDIILTLLDRK